MYRNGTPLGAAAVRKQVDRNAKVWGKCIVKSHSLTSFSLYSRSSCDHYKRIRMSEINPVLLFK